jgi:hypothetical protein
MPTYEVFAPITVTASTKVEAKNEKEALKKAGERMNADLGWQATQDENESWVVSELDGEVDISKAHAQQMEDEE